MASSLSTWSPREVWQRFRIEAEAAKHYHLPYSLYTGQSHRDPLLEELLPSLLFIRATAILDDAVELWLNQNDHVLKHPYKNDLNGRINYLGDKAILTNITALHDTRLRRNELAHEARSYCSWKELDSAIIIIESCLILLNLIEPTPNLEYFSERSALENSEDPQVDATRTFKYGIKANGNLVLEISWKQNFLRD